MCVTCVNMIGCGATAVNLMFLNTPHASVAKRNVPNAMTMSLYICLSFNVAPNDITGTEKNIAQDTNPKTPPRSPSKV